MMIVERKKKSEYQFGKGICIWMLAWSSNNLKHDMGPVIVIV